MDGLLGMTSAKRGLIELARMYRKVSRVGVSYLDGYLGHPLLPRGMKIFLFRVQPELYHNDSPPDYQLFLKDPKADGFPFGEMGPFDKRRPDFHDPSVAAERVIWVRKSKERRLGLTAQDWAEIPKEIGGSEADSS